MSAFLGPIHHWLYRKIKLQEELVISLVTLLKEKGIDAGIEEKVNAVYAPLPSGNLEDMIDETNIHGWLQERVSLVENRLAYVVTQIAKNEISNLDIISQITNDFGRNNTIQELDSARKAYQELQDRLLDGMPCDHVNQVISESDKEVVYQVTNDIHGQYWMAQGGDAQNYQRIKESLIKGMLENSPFEFEVVGNGRFIIRVKSEK